MSQSRPGTRTPQRRPGTPSGRPSQASSSRTASGRPASTAPSRASAPARRPASSGSSGRAKITTGGGFRSDLIKVAIGGAIAVVLALLLQYIWPDGFPVGNNQNITGTAAAITEIHSSGPVRLNEIMSSNSTSITTEDGDTADWFEVMNVSNKAVDLEGYEVAKTAGATNIFVFPKMKLEAGQCVTVFADSKLRANAGEELHAPFRISSAGDTLMLFNAAGTAVDTVNIPRLNSDMSYMRADKNSWQATNAVTPGMENTQANADMLTRPADDSPVVIAEISAAGQSQIADENGEYPDYIMLTNRSSAEVDMTGWYLSDNEKDTRKWRFPEVKLAAGETLTVFASGKDRSEDKSVLHTNFSLSSEGETVILSDSNGRRMDVVDYGLMKRDTVWSK